MTWQTGHAPGARARSGIPTATTTTPGGTMSRTLTTLALAAGIACAPVLAAPAHAQGKPPDTVSGSLAFTGFGQLPRDLDGGGDVRSRDLAVSGSVTRQFTPAFAAGVSLRYVSEDWSIGTAPALGGLNPLGRFVHPAASVNLSLALSRKLLVGLSATVEMAYERGAGAHDALVYGAAASVVGVLAPGRVLGLGANVSRQFYSVKVSPFVVVNWRLNERLRVANAPAAGPLGGAGVELRYAIAPAWEVAGGGVYRSDRYRLGADQPWAGQVAETAGIPLLARLARKLDPATRLDVSAGVVTNGTLKIKDSDGHPLAKDGYGVTPMAAVTLSREF